VRGRQKRCGIFGAITGSYTSNKPKVVARGSSRRYFSLFTQLSRKVPAMRLEATIPDQRANAAVELADELGLSRSQLMDEALSLFMKAVMEVRRGRRLYTVDPTRANTECEISTPTLAALEWALRPQPLELPPAAVTKMRELVAAPAKPNERLKTAATRHKR